MDVTRELRQTIAPTVERWLAALASTEPADRLRAQHGVARTYRADGRPMPDLVVWLDSPLAGVLAAHMVFWAGFLGGAPVKPLSDGLRRKQIKRARSRMLARNALPSGLEKATAKTVQTVLARDYLVTRADSDWWAVWDSLWRPIDLDRWRTTWTETWNALRAAIEMLDDDPREALLAGLEVLGADGWQRHGRDGLVEGRVLLSARLALGVVPLGFDGGVGAANIPFEPPWFAAHDAPWLAFFDYLIEAGCRPEAAAEGLIDVAHAAGWWWPFDHAVVMTERPCARHSKTAFSPVVVYRDGWRCWRR